MLGEDNSFHVVSLNKADVSEVRTAAIISMP
jgi:hypothetical protein